MKVIVFNYLFFGMSCIFEEKNSDWKKMLTEFLFIGSLEVLRIKPQKKIWLKLNCSRDYGVKKKKLKKCVFYKISTFRKKIMGRKCFRNLILHLLPKFQVSIGRLLKKFA